MSEKEETEEEKKKAEGYQGCLGICILSIIVGYILFIVHAHLLWEYSFKELVQTEIAKSSVSGNGDD